MKDTKEKFKQSAKQLSKAWDDAYQVKGEAGQGFEPEDARYAVALVMAEMGESKASGRLQITWEYLFLDGEYKGKTFRSYDGLDRPEGLPYVMRRIETLGYDTPESFEELEPLLKQISKDKPYIRIQVKTKGEFTNVYVLGKLEEDELPEGAQSVVGGKGRVTKEEQTTESPTVATNVAKEEKAEEEGLEIEEGMQVLCHNGDGEELGVGEILSIDGESEEVIVKIDGKKHVVPWTKLEKAPEKKKETKFKVKAK